MSNASPNRQSIFVSYSHEDGRYLDILKTFLKPIQLERSVEFWDDTRLKVGDDWRAEIDQAIRASRAFILLVSANFLASDFITSVELPAMIAKAKAESAHVKMYPILVSTCAFKTTELGKIQAANTPSTPLDMLNVPKRKRVLAQFVEQLRAEIADESSSGRQLTASTSVLVHSDAVPQSTVYRVDQTGAARYHTIMEAVQAAAPGSQIQVSKGTYRESLVIDKPLEIRGVGEVVVSSHDTNVISFQCSMGVLSNLAIEHLGTSGYGIQAVTGHLFVSDCDVRSTGLACIAMSGASTLHLTRNTIHAGKVGVLVYDEASGWLANNEVVDNAQAGIEVKGNSTVTLLYNRIHLNRQAGILFEENASGLLTDNDIWSNYYSGVEIRGGSPVLRHNCVHDGQSGGVFIHGKSKAILEHNDIYANAFAGVAIQDGADPVLRFNRIRENRRQGVFVSDGGRGDLEENDISANQFAGVEVQGGAPKLTRNHIHDGKQAGIFIHSQGSSGIFEHNDIFSNTHAGVVVQEGSEPVLRRNTIWANRTHGVFVSDGGRGNLEENDINRNLEANVGIVSQGDPILRKNTIHHGTREGVFISEGGRGTLEWNTIEDNCLSGVAIAQDGYAILRDNLLHNNDYGVYLGLGAAGTFRRNNVKGNRRKARQDETGESKLVDWDETNLE